MEKITIDCTPTWMGAAQICIEVLQHGNAQGRAAARAELLNMARLADCYLNLLTHSKQHEEVPLN